MDYVRLHASLHPGRPAVSDLTFQRQWSYEEFDRYVAGCVAVLAGMDIGKGDRVACLSKNRAEILALQLACARLGAIFVPLSWRLAPPELQSLIDDCEPSVLFGDDEAGSLGVEAQDIADLHARIEQQQPIWPDQQPEDLPSLMLYTSGTTGKPKGVLLSERNLTETAFNFSSLGEVAADSCFLCESPMFHIIGMVTSIRPPFLHGAHVLISDRFVPEQTMARLSDRSLNISHYFCVPQMALALRQVADFDPSKLRHMKAIFTGGAPHPEAQIREWLEDGVPIVDGFGMSEAGTVFGMPPDLQLIEEKAGCVGVPTERVRARIVNDVGEPLPPGEHGELELKGDNIAVGYWRREAEYNDAFTSDGWFRTGDILTRDKDGYFRVIGRKNDIFISGGENVYPVEVETHLVTLPGVKESAVVGVPDEKWGEVGCLFYVPESGDISLESVEAFLDAKLARYKIPKLVQAVDALPRNGVGKLMRHKLRSMFQP